MDDYERTVRRVRTEEVIEDPLATEADPVQPVVAAQPVVPAQPVMVEPPLAAAPVVATRDRVVTERATIAERPSTLEAVRRVVTLLFGILQGLIVLRVILLLLVANRSNDIVQLILGVTTPFVAPFADMFALERIGNGTGSTLDIGAIVALIGWTLIELLVLAVLNLGARRSRVGTY